MKFINRLIRKQEETGPAEETGLEEETGEGTLQGPPPEEVPEAEETAKADTEEVPEEEVPEAQETAKTGAEEVPEEKGPEAEETAKTGEEEILEEEVLKVKEEEIPGEEGSPEAEKEEGDRPRKKKKWKRRIFAAVVAILLLASVGAAAVFYAENDPTPPYVTEFEARYDDQVFYRGSFFAEPLCVTDTDIYLEGYQASPDLHAAGLFDLSGTQVVYSQKLFDRLYPASTTKVMTAYVALKYGNPDDIVTVSANARELEEDAVICELEEGDQLTLRDLLYGLLLRSGNDSAVAIAEHISGSVAAFAELMNEEAYKLGATKTHFLNPHGLHEEEHYTTAYDLYLMFNACLSYEEFVTIISQTQYTATVSNTIHGTQRELTWGVTNAYSRGKAVPPEGVRVIGGKTGFTDEAGSCVILYEENADGKPYISVVMGAPDNDVLYATTNELLKRGTAL